MFAESEDCRAPFSTVAPDALKHSNPVVKCGSHEMNTGAFKRHKAVVHPDEI